MSDARSGFASGASDDAGVFQVRMNNLTRDGSWDLSKRRRVPTSARQLDQYGLVRGDVLFNATNSPDLVGKTALLTRLDEPMVFSNHFVRLRLNQQVVEPGYVTRWLQMQFAHRTFQRMCRQWVNQATVSRDSLLSMALPLPPIDDQRRITDILDSADVLRVKRREALALLDDITESIFLEMFGDPLINTRGLTQLAIGDIGVVITGNTPPRADETNYGDDIEWIKSDNLGRGIFPTPAAEGLSASGRTRARVVGPGAVLITCIAGTPASIGAASIADREVAFNQQINAVVLENMHPMFFLGQLRVRRRLIQQVSTGGMKGLVSKSQLQRVSVLDAKREDQLAFAAKVSRGQTLRRTAQQGFDEIDDLFATLQQRAFAGLL